MIVWAKRDSLQQRNLLPKPPQCKRFFVPNLKIYLIFTTEVCIFALRQKGRLAQIVLMFTSGAQRTAAVQFCWRKA